MPVFAGFSIIRAAFPYGTFKAVLKHVASHPSIGVTTPWHAGANITILPTNPHTTRTTTHRCKPFPLPNIEAFEAFMELRDLQKS
jgi:hypothetical protein